MLSIFFKGFYLLKNKLSNSLEGNGERVDINVNNGVNVNKMNIYEKSHFYRYQFASDNIIKIGVTGDMACGTGYGSVILSYNSKIVIGIDINTKVISDIRKRYIKYKSILFLSDDLLNLKYSSYFNNIVSFETIEHFEEKDIPRLFKIFNKSLKKGGKLIFSVPYRQKKTKNAIKMGFHRMFNIDENCIDNWLKAQNLLLLSRKYQNYQTHIIEDNPDKKDFIICIAVKK